MSVSYRKRYQVAYLLFISLFLNACSGTMKVEEIYYLAVPSGENTNYFRIRIKSKTQFSDAKYEAHWVSADAVDALYSDQHDSDRASAINTEKRIREVINKKLESASITYLGVASNPESTDAEIQKWMKVYQRLRAMPSQDFALPPGTVVMEYNPIRNLVTTRAGQKMILMLSANPNDILKNISKFANSQETSASVLRLADIVNQQRQVEQSEDLADLSANQSLFNLLSEQLKQTEKNTAEADKTQLEIDIQSLINLAEALR